jgi:hypothetical protein
VNSAAADRPVDVVQASRGPAHRAGPGDEDPTPIGEPPDDDSDFDDGEDDDEDDEDDDEDPLQARPYCAAASPWRGQGGTMAAVVQPRVSTP